MKIFLDGSAYSWGCNNKGQLGHGFISKCEYNPKIIDNIKTKCISKYLIPILIIFIN